MNKQNAYACAEPASWKKREYPSLKKQRAHREDLRAAAKVVYLDKKYDPACLDPENRSAPHKFESLEKIDSALYGYEIVNIRSIRAFIADKPKVLEFLQPAHSKILESFSPKSIVIEHAKGTEEGERDKLFITVFLNTEWSPEKRVKIYNDFLDTWWLDESEKIENIIILGIT